MLKKLAFLAFILLRYDISFSQTAWTDLEAGLAFAWLKGATEPAFGENKYYVLKIDPSYFQFDLYLASERKDEKLPKGEEWITEFGLVAVINAMMYQKDYRTARWYMKHRNAFNNSKWGGGSAALAMHPKRKDLPEVAILDKNCGDLKQQTDQYETAFISHRLINCQRKVTWFNKNPYWSMGLIGEDAKGMIYFIFTRSQRMAKDFSQSLNKSKLGLTNLMYMDGAPPGNLIIRSGEYSLDLHGDYSIPIDNPAKENRRTIDKAAQMPLVVGIKRKKQ